ncbi:MAG: anaerobic ribonucleoside-triphosphate reductase activating protein [Oscillospiraceae bacterium]
MECKIKISGIVQQSIVDGPGLRFVVFTQGCPHKCDGCHNPQTHDFNGGNYIEISQLLEDFDSNPLLQGVTISGGEPFCRANELIPFAKEIKARNKNIYIFSGYYLKELLTLGQTNKDIITLLKLCDFLIDGPFIKKLYDPFLKFRGSSNQNIIELKLIALD